MKIANEAPPNQASDTEPHPFDALADEHPPSLRELLGWLETCCDSDLAKGALLQAYMLGFNAAEKGRADG